ncbi:uncharacterized protein LOC119172393 [Rhipicephalus microplus]|uniref:uncharacterized protein LOC119172393 n=1 Tax=Rhipicephalus microplus TaxID=6941 RepID=UPI003F6BC24D
MQPSNPFLFIPQIGTLLLLLGLSAACAERQPMLRPTFNGDTDLLINPASTDERYRSFNDGAGVTSSEPLGSPMTSPYWNPAASSRPFCSMCGATTNASTYFQRRYGSADKPSLN